jgi:ATP-dependent metalloprotease
VDADLANLVNMAAVKAAVDGIDKITSKQLEFAKDKLLMGTERKSMALLYALHKCFVDLSR